MTGHSYIIRFPDIASRNKFREALMHQRSVDPEQVVFAEFLPDVIVRNMSDAMLASIKHLADPKARFFEDVQFDLF